MSPDLGLLCLLAGVMLCGIILVNDGTHNAWWMRDFYDKFWPKDGEQRKRWRKK